MSFNRRVIGSTVIVAFYLQFFLVLFLFLLVMQIDELRANKVENVSYAYVLV